MKNHYLLYFLFTTIVGCTKVEQQQVELTNVLFIAVDDMADWVGFLGGHPDALTPNLDGLANRGVIFTNAHCTSPVCGPSRAAVMTGYRPETSGVYNNKGDYRDHIPNAIPIPMHFKNNGYYVMGAGKLIHPYNNVVPEAYHEFGPGVGIVGTPFTSEELATGTMPNQIDLGTGREPANLPLNGLSTIDRPDNEWSTFDWGSLDITDEEMPDGQIADWAVDKLDQEYEQPFFLAAGFYKPHQPLFAPRKYFDLYNIDSISTPETIENPLVRIPEAGKQFAHAAWSAGRHKTVMEHDQWKQGVLGYLATISFVDAQIGKILDALDHSKYADNTMIVFWSDHGWHLGTKEHWGKYDPWLESTRVPFIIVPAKNARPNNFKENVRVKAPVNLLDIYPTLISMNSLPAKNDLDGTDLSKLIGNPDTTWDNPSVATVGMGTHSIVNQDWHYIHYYDGTEELYNKNSDPHEWINLADDPQFSEIKDELKLAVITDPNHKHYVRYGHWKAVVTNQDDIMLFDFSKGNGISEHFNVADGNPEIVQRIRSYLEDNNIDERHIIVPEK